MIANIEYEQWNDLGSDSHHLYQYTSSKHMDILVQYVYGLNYATVEDLWVKVRYCRMLIGKIVLSWEVYRWNLVTVPTEKIIYLYFSAGSSVPFSTGVKMQAGKMWSTAQTSPTVFLPFQKHVCITCRTLHLLLNSEAKWSVRKFLQSNS
jgi:hypothetical protein